MDEEQLVARLSIVDDMSDTLSHISDAGTNMFNAIENASSAAGAAFDNVSSTAASSANAVENLSRSFDAVSSANAVSAASDLSSAVGDFESSAVSAASGTDYWTSAVGNYDKSALEAIMTTEQLVEAGYKTEDALFQEGESALKAQAAMDAMSSASEAAANVKSDLSEVIEAQNKLLEDNADTSKMSVEAKLELNRASREAADALSELEKAQTFAGDAAEKYDKAYESERLNLENVTIAAEQAKQASEQLAAAKERANKAADDLAKATDNAAKSIKDFGDESEENSKKASEALTAISETVAAVKIAEWAKNAASAIYDLTEAFSEAEKTVVNATGATGETLEGLENSMMSAFGEHHADLNSTAGAIGEINTRMALTGDALTDVTGKFLDFSSITGSDVVGSVQNVTKVMNKWNVEQSEVVSVLDKLAYAGQISGASVDSLSSQLINGASSFQAMGLSLDTTISLLSSFELQGINSGTAIMGLKTAVKNFSDDGLNAADALRDTVEQISNMGSEAEATSLAIDVFGSRAGVEFANAIRNGAITVEMLSGDLSVAEGTLQRTANASETLGEKWDKANNKITTAITNSLQPTIDSISGKLSELFGSVGDFLGEHPAAVKVIGAVAAGLGVVTTALTAYTVAVNLVIPAVTKFTAALSANPIGLWATVAATAIAVIGSLYVAFSDAEDAVADYDGTLEECSREIENTKLAHEKAVAMYGSESDAAKELEGQLATLNAQYEKGGGEVADYAARIEETSKAFRQISDDYDKKIKDIDTSQVFAQTAVSQLEALSDKSDKTNADLDLMSKYADYLNDTFECNIKVNYDTGELTNFDPVDIGANKAKEIAEANKRQAAFESVTSVDFQQRYNESLERAMEMQKKAEKPMEELNRLIREFDPGHYGQLYDESGELLKKYRTKNDFEQYNYRALAEGLENTGYTGDTLEKFLNLQHALEDYAGGEESLIGNYENAMKGYREQRAFANKAFSDYGAPEQTTSYLAGIANDSDIKPVVNSVSDLNYYMKELQTSSEDTADSLSNTWQKAMADGKLSTQEMTDVIKALPEDAQGAIAQFNDELIAIQEEYNALYEACKQSFEGQFGLLDQAQADTDATIQKLQEAQQTQLEYWQNYNANIEYMSSLTAEKLGMTQQEFAAFEQGLDVLKQQAASGDTEIAGLLDNIRSNIELGNVEAVADVVKTAGEVKAERDRAAEDTAQWVGDIEQKMTDAYNKVQQSVQNMNSVAPEARAAAINIMQNYIAAINQQGSIAISTAANIASQVSRALSVNASVNVDVNSRGAGVQHDAVGTTDSDDVFVAGEEGPELIVGKQHSTVFPTRETEKIIGALSEYTSTPQLPVVSEVSKQYESIINYGDTISHVNNAYDSSVKTDVSGMLQSLTDSIESVFIPIMGKTVSAIGEIASSDNNNVTENKIVLPEHSEVQSNNANTSSNSTSEKHIVIDINGNGKIEVSGNADTESILEVLQENLKPVLLGIIEQEVYEGGDNDYEY
jgi:TP901 family phage tail tape measure protein